MFKAAKDQLAADCYIFLDRQNQIKTKDLVSEYPERDYFYIFNNKGKKGKALRQHFFYLERLRRRDPDKFKVLGQYARKKMVFGLGSGSTATSLATPSKKRPKVDGAKPDELMLASPTPVATTLQDKATKNHYDYFSHMSLDELKEFCKCFSFYPSNKKTIVLILFFISFHFILFR